jgi:hypothetical protein
LKRALPIGIQELCAVNTSDDPISKLLPGCGNQGGFRAAGKKANKQFVVRYTSGEDKDWPDSLDIHTDQFVCYGDNKTPGEDLHSKAGNQILRRVFDQPCTLVGLSGSNSLIGFMRRERAPHGAVALLKQNFPCWIYGRISHIRR